MSTKHLLPAERLKIVTDLEAQVFKLRQQIIDLRVECFPHHYQVGKYYVNVICLGCGEVHPYRPGIDVIESYTSDALPSIQKAPSEAK